MTAKRLSALASKLRAKALSYPETEETFPWGEHAFKVNGKTFVFMRDDDEGTSFSVKLSASRDAALALPGAEPTHYGMGAKGWVTLKPTSRAPLTQLYEFIDESYRAVAPKRALRALDA
jgi:predicted DNA-binding protein (MmcQ/YjbR family)